MDLVMQDGCCSAIYVVVHQGNKVTQGLFTAKSRISKRGCSIPRLELISGHIVANALTNVKLELEGQPVMEIYGWLDSSVALHWILNDNRKWKHFVSIVSKKSINEVGLSGVTDQPIRTQLILEVEELKLEKFHKYGSTVQHGLPKRMSGHPI